jgi:glycerophosphoryl diester phosphodiesterase/SAM-dependent methyltransferase
MRIARVSSLGSIRPAAAARRIHASRAAGAPGAARGKHPRLRKRVASAETLARGGAAASGSSSARPPSCFACPVCGGALDRVAPAQGAGPGTLRCSGNHSFDVAREGHVNLLARRAAGKGKHVSVTGDSGPMLRARRRFLNAGHYAEVSELVCRAVSAHVEHITAAQESADARVRAPRAGDAPERRYRVGSDSEPEPDPEPDPGSRKNKNRRRSDAHPSDRKNMTDRSIDDGFRTGCEMEYSERASDGNAPTGAKFGTAGGYSAGINAPGGDASLRLSPRKRRIEANKRRAKASRSRGTSPTPASRPASPPPPLVVDFGCGEGWWLEQVARSESRRAAASSRMAPDASCASPPRFAAFDASPEAAKMASKLLATVEASDALEREHPAEVAVADAQRYVPFSDGEVDVALSVFAPRNPSELRRVVAPGGVALVVSPGVDHLEQLRDANAKALGVAVLDVAEGKQRRTADAMETAGFELVEETPVSGVMDLTAQDVSDLIGMGPSAFHQTEDAAEALQELFRNERSGRVEVTKSFVLQVFRNTPREEGAEEDEEPTHEEYSPHRGETLVADADADSDSDSAADDAMDVCRAEDEEADDTEDESSDASLSSSDASLSSSDASLSSSDASSSSRAPRLASAPPERFLPGRHDNVSGCALVGHRGDGMNRRSGSGIRENTVASMTAAAAKGAEWVEFDVQTTRDGVPVVWHDDSVLVRRGRGPVRKTSIRALTFAELRGLSEAACATAVAAKAGEPEAVLAVSGDAPVIEPAIGSRADDVAVTRAEEAVVFYRCFPVGHGAKRAPEPEPWIMDVEAPVPTLREVLEQVPDSLGFDVELKFDEHAPLDRATLAAELGVVRDVFERHGASRRAFFSSFDPEAALMMREFVGATHPVMFISNCVPGSVDERRNSLEAARKLALDGDLRGIVVNVQALANERGAEEARKAIDAGLCLATYGKTNDDLELAERQVRWGISGVCTDEIEAHDRAGHFKRSPSPEPRADAKADANEAAPGGAPAGACAAVAAVNNAGAPAPTPFLSAGLAR